jgi:2-phosphosulfolactate phosphatase
VEDYLGAGAVAAALLGAAGSPSVEVRLAAAAFAGVADVGAVLAECVSGRELVEAGLAADVRLAGEVGVSSAAPRLVDGVYRG